MRAGCCPTPSSDSMRASRFSVELEHPHEVLERRPLVAVREPRVHVGHGALGVGTSVSPIVAMSRSFSRESTLGSTGSSGRTRSGLRSRSGSKSSLTVLSRSLVEFAEPHSRPVEARAHRPDRACRAPPRSPRSRAPPTRRAAARRARPREVPSTASATLGHSSAASMAGVDAARRRSAVCIRCARVRAVALIRRASLRRCFASRFVAMPYSHGRALGRSAVVTRSLLEGDAEHLAEQPSASSGPTRRTR